MSTKDHEILCQWREQHGLARATSIAIIGGADKSLRLPAGQALSSDTQRIDDYNANFERDAHEIIDGFLDKVSAFAEDPSDIREFIVVCGGTSDGIPRIAAEAARRHKIKTVGVFPRLAVEKGIVLPDLDLALPVEPALSASKWGDESPLLAEFADILVVIGGSAGTMIEVSLALKRNESRVQRPPERWTHDWADPRLKAICPFHGTRGIAAILPLLPIDREVRRRCLPPSYILTVEEAVRFLRAHLAECSEF